MSATRTQRRKEQRSAEDLPELLRRRDPPLPLWLKGLCVAGAALLVLAGIVGWLVPVVTGIPFYLAALFLAGLASDRVRAWINAFDRKLPHRLRRRLRKWRRVEPREEQQASADAGDTRGPRDREGDAAERAGS